MADEKYLKILKLAPAPAGYFVSKKIGNLISRQRTDRVRKGLRAILHSAFAHSPALVYCAGGTLIEDDADPTLTRKTDRGFNRRRNAPAHDGIALACFRVMGWR
jgi:hypothetical protein